MNIELLAAGTRPPAWINEGFREYQKRLSGDWKLQLVEVPVARRTKGASTVKLKEQEGEKMLDLVKPGSLLVALDVAGVTMSTAQLAQELRRWMLDYSRVQIMIGGPDGLSDACLSSAAKALSLSKLTFPHFVVRMLVAEQLYRAWTIINNHPYHK